jgi:hypothetical protein
VVSEFDEINGNNVQTVQAGTVQTKIKERRKDEVY